MTNFTEIAPQKCRVTRNLRKISNCPIAEACFRFYLKLQGNLMPLKLASYNERKREGREILCWSTTFQFLTLYVVGIFKMIDSPDIQLTTPKIAKNTQE